MDYHKISKDFSMTKFLTEPLSGAHSSVVTVTEAATGRFIRTEPATSWDQWMSAFMKGYRDRQRR